MDEKHAPQRVRGVVRGLWRGIRHRDAFFFNGAGVASQGMAHLAQASLPRARITQGTFLRHSVVSGATSEHTEAREGGGRETRGGVKAIYSVLRGHLKAVRTPIES